MNCIHIKINSREEFYWTYRDVGVHILRINQLALFVIVSCAGQPLSIGGADAQD